MEKLKLTRVRTGCWTCKARRRKCDERRPICDNCASSGRECLGYDIRLSFDVDDSRNTPGGHVVTNAKGKQIVGFRGRPRLQESLAKRHSSEAVTPQLADPPTAIGSTASAGQRASFSFRISDPTVFERKRAKADRAKKLKRDPEREVLKKEDPKRNDPKAGNTSKTDPEAIDPARGDLQNSLEGKDPKQNNPASICLQSDPNDPKYTNEPKDPNYTNDTKDPNVPKEPNDPNIHPQPNSDHQNSQNSNPASPDDPVRPEGGELGTIESMASAFSPFTSLDLNARLLNCQPRQPSQLRQKQGTPLSPPGCLPDVTHVLSIINSLTGDPSGLAGGLAGGSIEDSEHSGGAAGTSCSADGGAAPLLNSSAPLFSLPPLSPLPSLSPPTPPSPLSSLIEFTPPEMSYEEENRILAHFFRYLLPLVDNLERTPMPHLALRHLEFATARGAFLALAGAHLQWTQQTPQLFPASVAQFDGVLEALETCLGAEVASTGPSRLKAAYRVAGFLGWDPAAHSACLRAVYSVDVAQLVVELSKEVEPVTVAQIEAQKEQPNKDVAQQANPVTQPPATAPHSSPSSPRFFRLIMLVYLHLLFCTISTGRTAFARPLLRIVGAALAEPAICATLRHISHGAVAVCHIAWMDTIIAVISPDCRAPYCASKFLGSVRDAVSTRTINGCPGEIFSAIRAVAQFRHDLRHKTVAQNEAIKEFERIRAVLLAYRDYVPFEQEEEEESAQFEGENGNRGSAYFNNLSCAQGWALATLVALYKAAMLYFVAAPQETPKLQDQTPVPPEPPFPTTRAGYQLQIAPLIREFTEVVRDMHIRSPVAVQMIWPAFILCCEAESPRDRAFLRKRMEQAFKTYKFGNMHTMLEIVDDIWAHHVSLEEVLSRAEWLSSGVELLPV